MIAAWGIVMLLELAGGRYPQSGIWPRGGGSSTPASHLDPSVDSHDIVANTLSATRDTSGALDARSQRRLYERLAELEGRDAAAAGEELEAMEPAERASALRTAVTAFQDRHAAMAAA